MKDVLKKLFEPILPTSRPGKINRRISKGKFELIDDMGRLFQAESSVNWQVGKRVVVQAGRIVDRSGTEKPLKTFTV